MGYEKLALIGSNSVHTIRYLEAITPHFQQVIFITNEPWQPLKNAGNDEATNILTYTLNFKLLNLACRRQIRDILYQHKIQLVHIQQANSYAWHTLKAIKQYKLCCRVILTTWGSDILVLPAQSAMFRRLVQFNLSNVDIITSDSLYMSEQIKKLTPQAKSIHTINFGMQNFPAQLDLSVKQNIILSNRLHKPLYNIDKIIQGFAAFIKSNLNFANYKLIIAASGIETNNLTKLTKQLGIENSVTFIGMLSYTALIHYYKIAKIFISIPSSDATSLSVLEAMAYGCYPILSNIPANLEWVLDGINGRICQNNSQIEYDIAAALNDTLTLNKAAEFNYELIKQKAVFENNIVRFLELYKI